MIFAPSHKPLPGHEPVIAVQLAGGLGNQMFQAAAGMALAKRNGARLVLDITHYRQKGHRRPELAPFLLDAETRGRKGVIEGFLRRKLKRLIKTHAIPPWWRGVVYRQPGYGFDAGFEALGSAYLVGYFQSGRFFKGCEAEIASAFNPEKLASPQAKALSARLAGEGSIALHLRRGDYVKNAKTKAFHGVLGWDYYDRAVALVQNAAPEARLFIFSDDLEAATEAMGRYPNAEVMRGESAGDDMFLMSRARHHILANSSFSWWSCWLDRREGSLRIAPKQWFTPEGLKTHPLDDLIPQGWVQV